MAFVLDPTASVPGEVRRVAQERLSEAMSILEGLADADATAIERGVHDVRKRCKEVRGLARLVRSSLGSDFGRCNAMVRDAADELSSIRDAHAVLATFDDLCAVRGAAGDADLARVRSLRAELVGQATSGLDGDDPRVSRARALLAAVRDRSDEWKIPASFDTLRIGLETTYRRGRRALRRARAHPTDENVHEWRKAAKTLWYQVRLIEQAAPSALESLEASLDDLAEALGDDHDLAVLVERLTSDVSRFGGRARVKHAVGLARAQQDDLRRRAFRLGETIYAESPAAFGARMTAYWGATTRHGPELATGGIADLAQEERLTAAAPTARGDRRVIERERKFLVTELPELPELTGSGVALRQGYVAIDGTVSVRVRDADAEGCSLTIKAGRGAVRTELEWPLTVEQFAAAWEQTRGRRVDKTRYRVPLADGHIADLDVFHENLAGLVIAEVEFDDDDSMAAFVPPAWFDREVTDDMTYTNASLAANAPRA